MIRESFITTHKMSPTCNLDDTRVGWAFLRQIPLARSFMIFGVCVTLSLAATGILRAQNRDLVSATQAITPTTGPAPNDIASLIDQLASPNWSERRHSREELLKMGEAAEPKLRRASKATDLSAESRKNIELLLEQIKADAAAARSLVNLSFKSALPQQAYHELAKQAAVQFSAGTERLVKDREQPINLQIEKESFWGALIEINQKSELAFDSIDSSGAIVLAPLSKAVTVAPQAIGGPCLVTINRVESTIIRARDFSGQPPLNVRNNAFQNPPCRLYLFAWAKPSDKPICWSIDSVEKCLTDTAETLTPANIGMEGVASGRVNTRNDTTLNLQGQLQGAAKIKTLRLNAHFIFERKRTVLDVPNILTVHNATYDLGGFRTVIKDVNKVTEGRFAYEVCIFRDARSPVEWERMRMLLGSFRCKLLDAEGKELHFSGGGERWGPNEITMNNTLVSDAPNGAKVGEPARLVWEFPTETNEFGSILEFKDIPLP